MLYTGQSHNPADKAFAVVGKGHFVSHLTVNFG